jgi:hypothetical protein
MLVEKLLCPQGMQVGKSTCRFIERAHTLLGGVIRETRARNFSPLHEFTNIVE